MLYLINPGNRIVQIEEQSEYNQLLNTKGFTIPDQKEIIEYQTMRNLKFESMRKKALQNQNRLKYEKDGIYMATVSQGGKDGYSVASEGMIRELNALGVNTTFKNNGQKIALLFHNPYSILRLEAPYRILYTMFESTKIPDSWLDYLESAEKILVPSQWCHDVFKKSGIETEVVPLGYDDRVYTYIERENKRKAKKEFVFLHYNAFNIRKGFVEVFQAFTKEFAPDEPVKLIFKTNLKSLPFPISPVRYPNIEVINGAYESHELADLCGRSDAFVFPSRGEGFGMTPLEAMATGLPTIVPNAHGITEYFNANYMYEVKVGEMCDALYQRYKNEDTGEMYVSDVADLRRQMRYVYEHQDQALEIGKKASEYVKQWSIKNTAKMIKTIFNDIISEPIPERKLKNVLTLEKI